MTAQETESPMVSLIVGGDSMIGAALAAALKRDGAPVRATTRRRDSTAPDRPWLDLADEAGWSEAMMDSVGTAYLCAAVARLNDCARDPAGSQRVNTTNAVAFAEWLMKRGVPVVFLSTNQVFDGHRPRQRADAPVSPRNVYGRQKAEAEAGILAAATRNGGHAAVLRLTKVIHPGMPLFDGWMADLRRGVPITPFQDMSLAPVTADVVVRTLRAIGERRGEGIYQLSAADDVSYAKAATHIARRIGADPGLVRPVSQASTGALLETPPRYTSMDTTRVSAEFGIAIPDSLAAVDSVLALALSQQSRSNDGAGHG